MKKSLTRSLGAALAAMLCTAPAYAERGGAHTLVAEAYFQQVRLQWRASEAPKTLQWHDDYDYNGDGFINSDLQKAQVAYAGAKFTAEDLKGYVGQVVDGITFAQYRNVSKVTGLVYENGEVVSQGVADRSKYEKNTSLKINLDSHVTIKENTEYIFAIKVEGGYNMDFVLMKDKTTDAPGKGDLYSTDGKTWVATGAGDYLVTANLVNKVDEAPTGYSVMMDGDFYNPADVTITSAPNKYSGVVEYTAIMNNVPVGKHQVYVSADYPDEHRLSSTACKVTILDFARSAPSAHYGYNTWAGDFKHVLVWTAPLTGGSNLTWGSAEATHSIGGTASKDTKVWFRNVFTADDLTAFGTNAKITNIKTIFTEAVINSVKLFIMKDGVIDYAQDAADIELSAIQANKESTFALDTPYELTPGHTYAYGLYVTHTPKTHPIGVTGNVAVDGRGNTFSVTSPSSKGFEKTSPTWKTLKSGGIPGNWALYATVEDATTKKAPSGYTLARDGKVIASGITATSYTDEVPGPGRYAYTLTADYGYYYTSYPEEFAVKVSLPDKYAAPELDGASYNRDTNEFNLSWNTDAKLGKCGDVPYRTGFDEEMAMMWGAQFTKDELAAYKGYKVNRIKFAIGAAIGDFKLGVYTAKGKALSEITIKDGEIDPGYTYTATLTTPVEITGEEDLYLAYNGTVPGGANALTVDAGPLNTGGARISLTNGLTWMNLATISSEATNNNIYISAYLTDGESGSTTELAPQQAEMTSIGISSVQATEEPISVVYAANAPKPVAKSAAVPRPVKFNIYRNGEVIATTTEKAYVDKLPSFNTYTYYVTAVYENDWESPATRSVSVDRPIAQKGIAPYALTGTSTADGLNLNWESPDKALSLTYVQGTKIGGLGLTGSNLTPHAFIHFAKDDLKPYIGQRIDHIMFGLFSTEVSDVAIEIAEDENIIYHQPVSSVVGGWNDVRLNEPYLIKGESDLYIGYTLSHDSGIKPLGVDVKEDGTFPSDPDKGDILTNSASPGYWYRLSEKFKLNYNWAIKAVLANDFDVIFKTQDAKDITYNVYYEGEKIREGLTATSVIIPDAKQGNYYVTAIQNGIESGESNKVFFYTGAIDDITVDDNGTAEYFNLQGIRVDADNLTPGIYLRRSASGKASKVYVK